MRSAERGVRNWEFGRRRLAAGLDHTAISAVLESLNSETCTEHIKFSGACPLLGEISETRYLVTYNGSEASPL